MNALALSLTPFFFSNEPFLIKGLLWRGGEGKSLKKKWKQTGGGGGLLSLWKNFFWFFKQQIEFVLISCLVVPKSFIKKA